MSAPFLRLFGFVACLWFAQGSVGVAAPSPRLLTEVADLSSVAISPDGRLVAFRQERASVERNTYDTAWLIASLDGAKPASRIAEGGTPLRYDYGATVSEPPQWSADSRWIYYRALFEDGVQVWRAAADGSHAEAVTHDPADILSFTLSGDGQRLLYTVGATRAEIERAEQAEYDRGILIDKTIPIGQGLYRSAYINGRLASVRMKGDWAARGGLLGDAPKRQRIVTLSSLEVRDATTPDLSDFKSRLPVQAVQAVGAKSQDLGVHVRSPRTGAIAFLVQDGAYWRLRVTPNAQSSNYIQCEAVACAAANISAIAWRPGDDEIVFTTYDHDRGRAQSLYRWDVKSGVVIPLVHAEGLISGGRGANLGEMCGVAALSAACVTAAADRPPRLERVDLQTGARQVLYDPNEALAQSVGPRAELLRWTDAKGQTFVGQFFPPVREKGAGPAPLFVTYYVCGGYLRGGAGDEWPLASLAGAGIAALCINEPRMDPLKVPQKARYDTAISAVSAIVEELSRKGIVDPKRVGMGGLSFGSEVVMWAEMKTNLLAAASVTSSSMTASYLLLHSLQGSQFRDTLKHYWGLGTLDETPEQWKTLAPAFNLDKIHAPLLMQMPEQEYLQTLDYFIPLANSTTPAEMYVFSNEPHQKFQPRHKLAAYERNLDWFRFWLQGYVDPDPLKAEQFGRWERMRSREADGEKAAASPP